MKRKNENMNRWAEQRRVDRLLGPTKEPEYVRCSNLASHLIRDIVHVEPVARALFQRDVEEDVCDGTWEENEALHDRIMADARAAIAAMPPAVLSSDVLLGVVIELANASQSEATSRLRQMAKAALAPSNGHQGGEA